MSLDSNDILEEEGDFLRNLSERNDFTTGELLQNQLHVIAGTQVSRLWMVALNPLRMSLTALLGWLLFLFVVKTLCPAVLFAVIEAALGMSLYVVFAFITVSVVLSFVFNLFGSFGAVVNLVRDILQGEAVCLEGRVSASSITEKAKGLGELHEESVEHFSYAIGNEYLPVNEEAHRVLRPYSGSVFRVYVTPRSRLLLSIEPVKLRRNDRLVK